MNIKRKIYVVIYCLFEFCLFSETKLLNDFQTETIFNVSNEVLDFVINNNYSKLSKYINTEYGLLISPEGAFSKSYEPILSIEDLNSSSINNKEYSCYLGNIGFPIKISIDNIFNDYFKPDMKLLEKIEINNIYDDNNYLDSLITTDNILNLFPKDSILIDYYFKPSGNYDELDWQHLILIFLIKNNAYYLLAIGSFIYNG